MMGQKTKAGCLNFSYNLNFDRQPLNNQCPSNIETSQLICRENQLAGFYMRGTLVVKGLKLFAFWGTSDKGNIFCVIYRY